MGRSSSTIKIRIIRNRLLVSSAGMFAMGAQHPPGV